MAGDSDVSSHCHLVVEVSLNRGIAICLPCWQWKRERESNEEVKSGTSLTLAGEVASHSFYLAHQEIGCHIEKDISVNRYSV